MVAVSLILDLFLLNIELDIITVCKKQKRSFSSRGKTFGESAEK